MCDEDAAWAAIDRERGRLADLLDDLDPAEWARSSLCAGWTVRDVAAHLALAQSGAATVLVGLARSGGSVDRMIRDTARRRAAVPEPELVAEIRAMIGSRRRAPGVSHLEPLIDVLVHTQDIAIPLQRDCPMPVGAAATAASRVWSMPWPLSRAFHARRRLRGHALIATDTDWTAGQGRPIEGPIEALLLLLTGRTEPATARLTCPSR